MAIKDNTTSLNSVLAAVNALPSGGGTSEDWTLVASATATETVTSIRVTFDACSVVFFQLQFGAVSDSLGDINIAPNIGDTFYVGEKRAVAASITTSASSKRGYVTGFIDTRYGSLWRCVSFKSYRADGDYWAEIEPDSVMNSDVEIASGAAFFSVMNSDYFTSKNLSDGVVSMTAYGAGMVKGTTLKVWGVKK